MGDKFNKILDATISFGLICLALVVLYNAMVRFLPLEPSHMAWTEDIGRLLLLWVCFIGAAVVTREDKHFIIDVFVKRMGARTRNYCKIASNTAVLIFLLILIWESILMVVDQMDQIMPSAIEIRLGFYSLSLLVGSIIMFFYVAKNFMQVMKNLGQ